MNTKEVCAPNNIAFGSKEIALHKDRVKKLQMRIVKAAGQNNKKEIVHPICHRKLHPELLKTSPVLIT